MTERNLRNLARRLHLVLHKSRARHAWHPEHGKYWLMQSDDYHPAAGYQGYAFMTLPDVQQTLLAFIPEGGR